jgi:uncharacterized protein
MSDVLIRLRRLQGVLAERFEIEATMREVPKAIATKSELLNRLKRAYIERNRETDEAGERIRSLRVQMQEAGDARERFERQITEIQTQREFEALGKEIRDAGEREKQLRAELQREERSVEELHRAMERDQAMIQSQETEILEDRARIDRDREQMEASLSQLVEEEDQLTPGLDEDLLFKFKRIIRSKEGLGIVPLRGGVCTGCNMILPMQFVNEVRSGDHVHFCPYCSLVLYYEEDTGGMSPSLTGDGAAMLDDEDLDGLNLDDADDEDLIEDEDGLLDEDEEELLDEDEDEDEEDEEEAPEDDDEDEPVVDEDTEGDDEDADTPAEDDEEDEDEDEEVEDEEDPFDD